MKKLKTLCCILTLVSVSYANPTMLHDKKTVMPNETINIEKLKRELEEIQSALNKSKKVGEKHIKNEHVNDIKKEDFFEKTKKEIKKMVMKNTFETKKLYSYKNSEVYIREILKEMLEMVQNRKKSIKSQKIYIKIPDSSVYSVNNRKYADIPVSIYDKIIETVEKKRQEIDKLEEIQKYIKRILKEDKMYLLAIRDKINSLYENVFFREFKLNRKVEKNIFVASDKEEKTADKIKIADGEKIQDKFNLIIKNDINYIVIGF